MLNVSARAHKILDIEFMPTPKLQRGKHNAFMTTVHTSDEKRKQVKYNNSIFNKDK